LRLSGERSRKQYRPHKGWRQSFLHCAPRFEGFLSRDGAQEKSPNRPPEGNGFITETSRSLAAALDLEAKSQQDPFDDEKGAVTAMPSKFLAFDIETAKILPKEVDDLLSHRPLGISCTATLAAGQEKAELFYSKNDDGSPAAKMSRQDLSGFVDTLLRRVSEGYTIVTLNGLGFDFDILAEESGRKDDCKKLALDHVDMMFHVFCCKGFGVGLNAAARAIGRGKTEDMDGSVAPQLWLQGDHRRVLDYVEQDCKVTLAVAARSERHRAFRWITQRNTSASLELPSGWLPVHQARKLPLPDTSWMTSPPWPRSKFTGWID
jgi:hypothetical protein